MRILSITDNISYPSNNMSFLNTWYFLLSCDQIKKNNKMSLITDRNMKFEYLPERYRSQYALFKPQILIIHLNAMQDKIDIIQNSLRLLSKYIDSDIRLFLLPTNNIEVNKILTLENSSISMFNTEIISHLTCSSFESNLVENHLVTFEFLKQAI